MIVETCIDKNICQVVQHGKTPYRMHSSVVVNVKEMEGKLETLLKTNDKESNRGTLTIGNFGFP